MSTFIKSAVLLLLMPLLAQAQGFSPLKYQAGSNYEVLEPQRTADAQRIEVKEIFWYGCGHCFTFEPIIHNWAQAQADDVLFLNQPAMWNQAMKTHAQMFYAAKTLGLGELLHQPLFNAMHIAKKKLNNADEIFQVFATAGVNRPDFDKAWKSFSVNSQVKRADQQARAYRIKGTPEIIVNGKYRVSSKMAGSQQGMLAVVDFLVAQERRLLKQKPAAK